MVHVLGESLVAGVYITICYPLIRRLKKFQKLNKNIKGEWDIFFTIFLKDLPLMQTFIFEGRGIGRGITVLSLLRKTLHKKRIRENYPTYLVKTRALMQKKLFLVRNNWHWIHCMNIDPCLVESWVGHGLHTQELDDLLAHHLVLGHVTNSGHVAFSWDNNNWMNESLNEWIECIN